MAKNQTKSTVTKPKNQKIPVQTATNAKKANHKRRTKGTSEVDNPKFASMDFMLNLVESAAKKEDQRESQKLAKKALVAKIIEEKDAKKELKAEEKKAKLEKIKQAYLEAHKKKKAEAKKQKIKAARQKAMPPAPEKKRVRFA